LDRRTFLKSSALPSLSGLISGLSGGVARASAAASEPAVRLSILGDNAVARAGVKAVWGFACLVEARGRTVLFDTGAGVLKENLAALKVDAARIEAVVISHYHGDHTWGAPGLGKLPGVRALTPRSFDQYPKEAAALQSAGLRLVPVSQTTTLFEGMTVSTPLRFGGTIALPSGKPGQTFADDAWEQCLTVDTPAGLAVIVGCSHPGILPMLEQVRRQSRSPMHFVIGGFHLLSQKETEVRRIATAMQAMGVAHVSATHCNGETAAHVFRDVFGSRYIGAGVGAVIDLPLG